MKGIFLYKNSCFINTNFLNFPPPHLFYLLEPESPLDVVPDREFLKPLAALAQTETHGRARAATELAAANSHIRQENA